MTMRVMVNGNTTELDEPASVHDVVTRAVGTDGKSGGQGMAVAVNSEVVPRGSWANTNVNAGDRIEILTATQGG